MSKNWYPIIDVENCSECGSCIEKCSHGVYDENSSFPKVIYPEGCIEGCTGCQSLCPSDAISYFGDSQVKEKCSCGCC